MYIFNELLTYFGVNRLSECVTFPELLEWFLMCLFAIVLILFIFKMFFNAVWQIQNNLLR